MGILAKFPRRIPDEEFLLPSCEVRLAPAVLVRHLGPADLTGICACRGRTSRRRLRLRSGSLAAHAKSTTDKRPTGDIRINTDFLTLTAELSLGIAGFSGVIVALESRSVRSWTPLRRRDLRVLLQLSGLALLFSLMPLLAYPTFAAPSFWKWALGLYGFVHLLDLASFLIRQPEGARLHLVYPGVAVAVTQVALAILASDAIAEVAYLGSVLWHLAGAVMGFVFLIWNDHSDNSDRLRGS